MKRLLYTMPVLALVTFLLSSGHLYGQLSSQNENYILKKVSKNAEGTSNLEELHYYDGLGRLVETVKKKYNPSGKDLVIRHEYDAYGRESKTWLAAGTTSTDGRYNGKSNAATLYNDP